MKNKIFTSIAAAFVKAGTKTKKHSPEILVVAGIVGVVVSAVMACKATRKVDDIMETAKTDIEKVHECSENKALVEKYTDQDKQKDLAIIYARTGIRFVKLYLPSVALGILSITSIVTSNQILRRRNVALAAAYTAVDKGFKEYRSRVIERFGEEVEKELRYNLKAKVVEETVIDENGKEAAVKKEVKLCEADSISDYARFFDESCEEWQKDSEYNLMFLTARQQYANDLLRRKGHLFLNEVYDMLGIPRTKAGQVVGWIYDKAEPLGDNYVDFGIYNICREKNRDFVNGYERVILLDFNVDGNILDRI